MDVPVMESLPLTRGPVLSASFADAATVADIFDRLSSPEFEHFIKRRKPNCELLKLLMIIMTCIKKVLNDAEMVKKEQITNPAVKEWLHQLKLAVYEADDLLDDIAYEGLRLQLEGNPQSSIRDQVRNILSACDYNNSLLTKWKDEMEAKVEEAAGRFASLLLQGDSLGPMVLGIRGKPEYRRLQTFVPVASGFYGRDGDKEAVVKLLLSNNVSGKNFEVISIVGMGGAGKTTLAQYVYNDIRVQQRFDLNAWVNVSVEFDALKLTKDILRRVCSVNFDGMNLDQLRFKLKDHLRGRKFLLVLDDVWCDKRATWDFVLSPLEIGALQGSKILVTTRSETVASALATVSTHCLHVLSLDDCWRLFAEQAFEDGISSAHGELQEIGKQIVSKCQGLPLAAKCLGGLLRSNRDAGEWEMILKSDLWDMGNQVLPALRLSYYYLPSHLKECFAYCALLPKDYEFQKEELVLFWMAEGYIDSEEVGDEYFCDLVSRFFFLQSSRYQSCFIMHDLVHDLAKFVSGEFCCRLEGDNSCKITRKTCHLSYKRTAYDALKKFRGIFYAKLLRSFLPLGWSQRWWHTCIDLEVIHGLFCELRSLRVLSLSQYQNVADLPDSIGNLKHLRYLNLSATSIKRLPL